MERRCSFVSVWKWFWNQGFLMRENMLGVIKQQSCIILNLMMICPFKVTWVHFIMVQNRLLSLPWILCGIKGWRPPEFNVWFTLKLHLIQSECAKDNVFSARLLFNKYVQQWAGGSVGGWGWGGGGFMMGGAHKTVTKVPNGKLFGRLH